MLGIRRYWLLMKKDLTHDSRYVYKVNWESNESRTPMNISTKEIVSNSEMIKNYKTCRDRAEESGRLIILKNNLPDAVLFSIAEYEKLSLLIEYMESMEEKDFIKELKLMPDDAKKKTYTIEYFKNDAQLIISIDEIV